jgi:hypothetical protein
MSIDIVIGTIIGAVGIIVSVVLYVLGARGLKQEAERLMRQTQQLRSDTKDLKNLNGLTLRILDLGEPRLLPPNVEPTKDEAGNYTGGLTYKLSGVAHSRSSATAIPTVSQPEDDTDASGQEPDPE